MRCILHIGTEKTGTTTLQRFLHLNRQRLGRRGLLVPTAAGFENQSGLAVASYREDRRDDLTTQWQIGADRAIHRFRIDLRDRLAAEVAAGGCQTLVCTSEHLQSRLTAAEEVASLRLFLEAIGARAVEVVVYLRRPAEILNSLCSTLFSNGHHMPAPPGPDHHYLHNLCDHRGTIERWSEAFGRDALRPRIYGPKTLVGGSILDDFAAATGIDTAGLVRPASANRGLSAIAAEVLHRVNVQMATRSPAKPISPSRDIVAAVDAVYGQGPAYALPAEAWDRYDEAFAESDEWVRRAFFPERDSLWEDAARPAVGGCGLTGDRLDRIAEQLAEICIRRGWCRPRDAVPKLRVPGLPQRLIDKTTRMMRRAVLTAAVKAEHRQSARTAGSRP